MESYKLLLVAILGTLVCVECSHHFRKHRVNYPVALVPEDVASNIQCSDSTWNRCMGNLAKELGVQSIPKDLQSLERLLEPLMGTQQGFEGLCSGARELESCLGEEAVACFSVQHLEHVGVALTDTLQIKILYYELVTECNGDIFNTLDENYDCLINVSQQYQDLMQHCVTDYVRNLQHDPEHICHFTQEFIACTSKPFKDHCNKALGNAICQVSMEPFTFTTPQCKKLNCDQSKIHKRVYTKPLKKIRPSVVRNDCDQTKFGVCLSNFKESIGFSEPFPSEAAYADHQVNDFLMEDRENLKTYCRSVNQFTACLGSAEDSCISTTNLHQHGISKTNAKGYLKLYGKAKYECSEEALNVLYYNYDCIKSAKQSHKSVLEDCQTQWYPVVASGGCQRYTNYFSCVLDAFQSCSTKTNRVLHGVLRVKYCDY